MSATSADRQRLPVLAGPAEDIRYCEVVGERIALLGFESGVFELWVWPIKVAHDFRIVVRDPATGADPVVARRVEVSPYELVFTLTGQGFFVRLRFFASRTRRAVVMLVERANDVELELELSFVCDFRPMWPAGMGGQTAAPDGPSGGFVLTEELGRFATIFGGEGATLVGRSGDHSMPTDPIRFTIPLPKLRTASDSAARDAEPIVFAIAGAELDPGPLSPEARLGLGQSATGLARAAAVVQAARDLLRDVQTNWRAEKEEQERHWSSYLARTTTLTSSDPKHDEAFLWSKIAIERAWVRVDGLGRGLVAGLGTSRGSERPGFAWFFDGDAMVASRSLTLIGDFEGAREILRFAASHQREDGKLMHELTLSARLCRWTEDYPYAFYKGINAPDFVAALAHYVAWSGDLELGWELFRSVEKAIEWCASCTNELGLMSNRKAGLAAVEAGPLSDRIESDIFLQGAWIAALHGGIDLARRLGRNEFGERCARLSAAAYHGCLRLWREEEQRFPFALLVDGSLCVDRSAYQASAYLAQVQDSRPAVAQLNHPELASDWGLRMFAVDAPMYDPEHYNTGAVFPYLTNFAIRALFHQSLGMAARQVLGSQIAMTGFRGRGLLEEHFSGDRARIPARGVPHQIFSSSTVLESTLDGLVGLEADAVVRQLSLHASLPPPASRFSLDRVRVGKSVLRLELERSREGALSVHRARVAQVEGPELTVNICFDLEPLSIVRTVLLDGCELPPRAQEPERGKRTASLEAQIKEHRGPRARTSLSVLSRLAQRDPSRRVVPEGGYTYFRFDPHSAATTSEWKILVEDGPSLVLPIAAPEPGQESSHPRLSSVLHDDKNDVAWRVHGRSGSRASLPFHCGRPVVDVYAKGGQAELADGELKLEFPSSGAHGWAEMIVHVVLAPSDG